MEISEYRNNLCEANQRLLEEIEKTLPVIFEKSNKKCWQAGIRKQQKCAVVYCMNYFSNDKIAHELLHIRMGLILGDNGIMLKKCGKNPILKMLFNNQNNAASQILNAYEHLVIFKQYLAMGFDRNEFFEDQSSHDYDNFICKLRTKGIRTSGKISVQDFMKVFACLFSYLFFPIDDRFCEQLSEIKKAERELFGMLQSFKKQLLNIPINDKGRVQIQKVYSTFMYSLDKYIMKNCDTNDPIFKI